MRLTSSRERPAGARSVQRRAPDRLVAALGRYRLGGRRSRLIRRVAAVALLVAAGAVAALRPTTAAEGTPVQVAAHDLAAGDILFADDVRTSAVRSPPDGALTGIDAVVGHAAVSPIRRGEILTDVRILGNDGLDPGPGRTAVPIHLADPGTVALLHPGLTVGVVIVDAARFDPPRGGAAGAGTDAEGAADVRRAVDAVVLAVPPPDAASGTMSRRDAVVVLAVPDADVGAVTMADQLKNLTLTFG